MNTAREIQPQILLSAPPRSRVWRNVWTALSRKPERLIGFFILVFFMLMAVFGPMIYPSKLPIDPTQVYAPPSAQHWLGTDYEGTDILALIVTGSRYVIVSAGLAAVFTVLFGTTLGLVSGYFLGPADTMIMRVTDFVLTVPTFPLLIVLSTIWHFGSPWAMGLVLGATGWGWLARSVRSQTLSLRERSFVEAVRALGMSTTHVILKEIFPNVAPFIAMNLLTTVTGSIYAEVGLFFLGVVPFTANNWGVMFNMALNSGGALYNPNSTMYLVSPMVCILLLTFGIILILDAVDEIFNPRLRES